MIPLNVHNILDYVGGALLILAPSIFGFADVPAARNLFIVLGAGLIVYSLFTRYKYSIAKIIPLGTHMALDSLAGITVLAAPWIFNYRPLITEGQLIVHFVLGLGVLGLVAFTRPKTESQIGTRDTFGHTEVERIRREQDRAA